MNWATADRYNWTGPISNRAAKEEAGRRIAEQAGDGQVIGVGSGSTSFIALQAIAERVHREGLRVSAVCTARMKWMAKKA
jgi:ribose 5-phosphate isomerase A